MHLLLNSIPWSGTGHYYSHVEVKVPRETTPPTSIYCYGDSHHLAGPELSNPTAGTAFYDPAHVVPFRPSVRYMQIRHKSDARIHMCTATYLTSVICVFEVDSVIQGPFYLHSITLRRHLHRQLHRHRGSTRWEPLAVCSAAAKKSPSRECHLHIFTLDCSALMDMT